MDNDHSNDDNNEHNYDENEILSIVKITPTMLLNMCPTLLSQLDEKSCLDVIKVEMGKKDKTFAMGNFLLIFSLKKMVCSRIFNI